MRIRISEDEAISVLRLFVIAGQIYHMYLAYISGYRQQRLACQRKSLNYSREWGLLQQKNMRALLEAAKKGRKLAKVKLHEFKQSRLGIDVLAVYRHLYAYHQGGL